MFTIRSLALALTLPLLCACASVAPSEDQPDPWGGIRPGDQVYEGQIVGENSRPEDMTCNPTKKKQVTNHRSATKEIDTVLKVPRDMGLDQAMEWIADDELVEVTPEGVRVRKALRNLSRIQVLRQWFLHLAQDDRELQSELT